MTNTESTPNAASPEITDPTGVTPNAMSSHEFEELLKQQVRRVTGKLPLLGAVAWLMMQQASTRHTLLSELEWRIMPPLILDQTKIYMREDNPVAYVSWAMLSPEVSSRYCVAPHQLTAADWKSGNDIWIIDLFAPFGGGKEVIAELRNEMFRGKPIHQLQIDCSGTPSAFTWAPT